jgi:phosphate-selective porin OprO and OprP
MRRMRIAIGPMRVELLALVMGLGLAGVPVSKSPAQDADRGTNWQSVLLVQAAFAQEPAPAVELESDRFEPGPSVFEAEPRSSLAQFLSRDEYPSVEVNGVFQVDSGWFSQDAASRAAVGNIRDGASFRRARLSASGGVAENLDYRFEMDFAFFGRPTFTDLWMEFQEVPVLGNVRIGQWKQPFSLEVVSPFRYTTFAERSLLFPAFTPFRHIAVGFLDHTADERMTWAASVYRSGQDQFGGSLADRGGYAGVGRITWLPWFDEVSGGRSYLHLGAAYNYVVPNNRVARFRTVPEYFVFEQRPGPVGTAGVPLPGVFDGVPFFVDTGLFGVRHYNLVGTELLWVEGPFSLQSEFMYLAADRTDGGTAGFPGVYVQCGYFLTGEHRPFNRPRAFITRIIPFRDVTGPARGRGAWELATRWSAINLNDGDIRGGALNNWTLGLNWYMTAYSKLQLNFIRAFLDDPAFGRSVTDIYGLRAQLDF